MDCRKAIECAIRRTEWFHVWMTCLHQAPISANNYYWSLTGLERVAIELELDDLHEEICDLQDLALEWTEQLSDEGYKRV